MRPQPRLHFVEDQQQLVLVGQLAQAGQEAVGRNPHAAFALDRLDHDGGRLVVDQPGDGVEVAEGGVDEAGHQRPESLVVLGLGGGRVEPSVRPWKPPSKVMIL